MIEMTDEQARDEVNRRFQVWGWQSAPTRKYALLVAGYFRSRGPFFVEGEEKYLRFFNDDGLGLLELVEASADRPLTASERLDAIRRATDADGVSQIKQYHYAVGNLFHGNPDASYLRLALDDPQEAARVPDLLVYRCNQAPQSHFLTPLTPPRTSSATCRLPPRSRP